MNVLTPDSHARIILRTEYSSHGAHHVDHYYCRAVNLWRDFFRPDHLEILIGLHEGSTRTLIDNESIIYDPSWSLRVRHNQWCPPQNTSYQPQPKPGRWYPQGFLSGVANIYPQTLQPMRIVAVTEDNIEVDCNHPLAGTTVSVSVHVEAISVRDTERGGRCTDWLEEALADGPGMQMLRDNVHAEYQEPDQFARVNSQQDSSFYAAPRMVGHIDRQAEKHLLNYTSKILAGKMNVLDLMSSTQSHLPEGVTATGLGMNGEEMQANNHLSQWLIHDLNDNPSVPFAAESFDAVCCHLSFEYLLHPEQVMVEVARVLKPQGLIIISVSNRWFPEKVTRIWQQLHEFERLGYVMENMRGAFHDFTTTSFRNWPRPRDDKHFHRMQVSDPLYVVTGRRV